MRGKKKPPAATGGSQSVEWVRDYVHHSDPLTAAKSVALHRGPVCRGKAGDDD